MRSILIVARNFPPTICGVGDYSFHLYIRLKSVGHNVKVLTQQNTEVRALAQSNGSAEDVLAEVVNWDFSLVSVLRNQLRKVQTDQVIFQYVPNSLSRYALPFYLIPISLWLRLIGVKVGYFFHEVSVRVYHNGLKSFLLGSAQRLISNILALSANFSFTSTKLYQTYFLWAMPELVPIPANLFKKQEWRQNSKQFSTDRFVVSFFANRCTDEIIKALVICKTKYGLNLHVQVLGLASKERVSKIKRRIEEFSLGNVTWHVNKTSNELTKLIYVSDLFLHLESVSIRNEGGVSSKSGVLAAIMAAGVPVIGTKGDMTDETIHRNRESVFFINQITDECIAHTIFEIRNNTQLLNSLSKNEIDIYRTRLSWDNCIEHYLRVLS